MVEGLSPYAHPIFESVDSLRQAVLKVCDTYPENRNAVDTVADCCVYEDEQGQRCLMGQVMVENGLPVPEGNAAFGWYLRQAGKDQDVASEGLHCQGIADTKDHRAADLLPVFSIIPRLRWADVAQRIREERGDV